MLQTVFGAFRSGQFSQREILRKIFKNDFYSDGIQPRFTSSICEDIRWVGSLLKFQLFTWVNLQNVEIIII